MVHIILTHESHYLNHVHILTRVFFNSVKSITEFYVIFELHEQLKLQ